MSDYSPTSTELDVYLDAFEEAQVRSDHEPPDVRRFIPQVDHPQYLPILREIVRVDMEYGWRRGAPRRLDYYQGQFPELFKDHKSLQDITFEEYRLRRLAGENPHPIEYQKRFGVITVEWPKPASSLSAEIRLQEASAKARAKSSDSACDLDAALAYLESLVKQAEKSPGPPGGAAPPSAPNDR